MRGCHNRRGVGDPGGRISDELARHLLTAEVWETLTYTRAMDASLLMNIGPCGDGAIHPHDAKVVREIGVRVRKAGFPER